MNFDWKSLMLCACLCAASVLAAAQGTTCAADGDAPAPGSALGCVTGEGAQVKAADGNTPQAPDAPPLTPEQRPPNPPTVTYEDGKLTIIARNSTLSDILQAVGTKTGAAIDAPEGATERVVSQLGPGPAREVIATLLNGSHFNYVMVGTEANPNSVAHVILTAKAEKTDKTEGVTVASGAHPAIQARTALQQAIMQPYQEMLQQQQAQQASSPDFQAVAAQEPAASPQPEPAAQANNSPGGSATIASNGSGGSAESGTADAAPVTDGTPRPSNASGERSPQQMLQDLYEARKQMMQQQQRQTQPPPQQ
jgi:hypothetical protein